MRPAHVLVEGKVVAVGCLLRAEIERRHLLDERMRLELAGKEPKGDGVVLVRCVPGAWLGKAVTV